MAEIGNKFYLEGFRHRDTGCLYFSAAAQSAEAAEPSAAHVGVDAECQAHYTRADAIQTLAESETQTPAPGAPAHAGRVLLATGAAQHISVAIRCSKQPSRSRHTCIYHHKDDCDIFLAAATHVPAAAARAVTLIQAQARGWLVRKHISEGVSGLRNHLSEEQEHGKNATAAATNDEEQRRDLQRQLHPKTAADFAILHEKVRHWMAQVTRRVLVQCYGRMSIVRSAQHA